MKDLISVVVPAFNASAYIDQCLSSIQRQTYQNFEVVIVDDGSTDDTGAICQKYAADDKRFHLLRQANAGVSAARNAALAIAKGEYIAFVDSDDWIAPEYLRALLTAIQGADMVFSGWTMVGDAGDVCSAHVWDTGTLNADQALITALKQSGIWAKLYRADLIYQHKLRFQEDLRDGEDLLFNGQYIMRCANFRYLNRNLYFWRMRVDSVSHLVCADGFYCSANRRFVLRKIYHDCDFSRSDVCRRAISAYYAQDCADAYCKESVISGKCDKTLRREAFHCLPQAFRDSFHLSFRSKCMILLKLLCPKTVGKAKRGHPIVYPK